MFSETEMDDLDDLFTDIDGGEMQLFPLAIGEQTNSSAVENQQQQLTSNSLGNVNLFSADTYTSNAASAAPLIPITVEEVNSTVASDITRFVSEIGSDIDQWDTEQHSVPNIDRDFEALGERRRVEARVGGGKPRSRNTKRPCASEDSPFGSTQATATLFPDGCNQLMGGIYQRDAHIMVSSSCTTQNDPEDSSGSEFKDSESVKQDKRREQNKRAAEKCRQKRKVKEKQLFKDLEEAEKSKQQKMQEILPLLRKVQMLKALLQSHQASGSCCFDGRLQSPIDS